MLLTKVLYDILSNPDELDKYSTHAQELAQSILERMEELERETNEIVGLEDDFLYAEYDQRESLSGRPKKWYTTRRSKKKGICAHHSGVHRGFGVSKRSLSKLSLMHRDQDRALGYVTKCRGFINHGNHELDHEALLRMIGLAERYQDTAYQAISGPNSVLYWNLPFDYVTWASNGANTDYLAWCWDGHSKKHSTGDTLFSPVEQADIHRDLCRVVDKARDEGHEIETLTMHSVYTNKPSDASARFLHEILVPVAEAKDLKFDLDYKDQKRDGSVSLGETADRGGIVIPSHLVL